MKKKIGIAMAISILFLNNLFAAQPEPQVPPEAKRPDAEYKADDTRDPFLTYLEEKKETSAALSAEEAAKKAEKPLPALAVQGIIWGGSFPQAIINNKVVKAGDVIAEGVRIIEIDKNGVKVNFNGREYDLSSPGGSSGGAKEGGNNEQ